MQSSNTSLTFSAIIVNLQDYSGTDPIKSAYVEFNAEYVDSSDITGVVLSVNGAACASIGALTASSAESQNVFARADVTNISGLDNYAGGNVSLQVGYRINETTTEVAFQGANAKIVITYTYSDTAATQLNTVIYPLQATSTQAGSKTAQTAQATTASFTYRRNIPGATSVSQWFEVMGEAAGNATTTDLTFTANIGGGAPSGLHELGEARAGDGPGYKWLVDALSGYGTTSDNTTQTLNVVMDATSTAINALGGESYLTYTYPSSTTTKTKTVRYGLGEIITLNNSTTKTSKSVTVYLPETGVVVKDAWFRIIGSVGAADTLKVSTQVGAAAETAQTSYAIAYAAPSQDFTVIHGIPYTEIDAGNITSGTAITLYVQWTTGGGAVSGELLLTYQYTCDAEAYQNSVSVFAGQQTAAAATSYSYTTLGTYFPESTGKTMVSAYQFATVTNRKNAATNTHSSNIGGTGGLTSTAEAANEDCTENWYHDVTSQITTSDATYTANYSSGATGTFTGVLVYTYTVSFVFVSSTLNIDNAKSLAQWDGSASSDATLIQNGQLQDILRVSLTNSGCQTLYLKSFTPNFQDASGTGFNTANAQSLFNTLYIYYSSNENFDGSDTIVASVNYSDGDFTFTSGDITINRDIVCTDTSAQLAQGATKYYFLVVKLRTDAATITTPKAFSVNLDPTADINWDRTCDGGEAISISGSSLPSSVCKAAYWRAYAGSAISFTTPHIRFYPPYPPYDKIRMYFGTSSGEIYCYKTSDGGTNWTNCWTPTAYDTGTEAVYAPYGYDDGTNVDLYFGRNVAGAGNFYALRDSGSAVALHPGWTTNPINLGSHGLAVQATPTIKYIESETTKYRIYVGCTCTGACTGDNPGLHCLDATTGGACSGYADPVNDLNPNTAISSFTKAGSTYEYVSVGTNLHQVNKTGGAATVTCPFSNSVVGYPYIVSLSEMYITEGGNLHKRAESTFNACTTTPGCPASVDTWCYATGGTIGNAPFAPAFSPDNNKIFIGTTGGILYAVNRNTGDTTAPGWTYSIGSEIRTQPMYVRIDPNTSANNYVVVSSGDGYIYFIYAGETGTPDGVGDLRDKGYLGQVAAQNCTPVQVPGQNKVIVGSTNGYIFCFPVP